MTELTTPQAAPHGSSTDVEGRRRHVHAMWSAVADSWAEYADYTDARHGPETAMMLATTAPAQGEQVLELAAGAGGLGLAAADLVGPDGRVLISDVAVEMTRAARARIGVRMAVEVRQLDLEARGSATRRTTWSCAGTACSSPSTRRLPPGRSLG